MAERLRLQPSKDRPHAFRPRRHGSRDACDLCGAAVYDAIHDVPQRREEDRKSPRRWGR